MISRTSPYHLTALHPHCHSAPERPPTIPESIVDISRDFFQEIVKPILAEHFPDELSVAAIGIFGHGSEALRLDDEYSSDHHWGLRIDALFPHAVYVERGDEMREVVSSLLPPSYAGHSLREAHVV